jgi:hypothetical protein
MIRSRKYQEFLDAVTLFVRLVWKRSKVGLSKSQPTAQQLRAQIVEFQLRTSFVLKISQKMIASSTMGT